MTGEIARGKHKWYFEEHLEFPFTKKVRAQTAAASMKMYGEELFKQVFGDPDNYAEYRDLLKAGLNNLKIEIASVPEFHTLHWESIKDPKLTQPLALQAAMVRKNLKPQALPATVRSSPVINLLIVVYVIHFDVHGTVMMYEQFQQIQKEPADNPLKYKRYARDVIQPYEGVKAFLSFEADKEEQEKNLILLRLQNWLA